MSKPAIIPAGHRAVSIADLDRLDAVSSKTIGLLALLAALGTSEQASVELNFTEAEGVRRLASELGSELERAVEAVGALDLNPDQAAA